MRRLRIVLPVVSVLAVVLALVASSGSAALHPGLGQDAPLGVARPAVQRRYLQRRPRPGARRDHRAQRPRQGQAAGAAASSPGLRNLQMNDDWFPPMPQNETAVDYSRADPLVAVAAANDYVSGGVVVMRTADGGKSWKSTGSRRSSAAPATSAVAATPRSPTAAATTPST